MVIGATLHHVHLSSPQPGALARFYVKAFGFEAQQQGSEWVCRSAGRRIVFSDGPAHRIKHIAFAFSDAAALAAYRVRVGDGEAAPASALTGAGAMSFSDPDGNRIVFITADAADAAGADAATRAAAVAANPASSNINPASSNINPPQATLPPAASQHLALRTTQPDALLAFYQERLDFKLSDRVEDEQGTLRACFLRTGAMHHALALFRAPETRFDHQSFETTGWPAMRDWADHMGSQHVPIVWGIGRHGPGNDTFFMVQDPDGNLAEISCDLEVCEAGHQPGVWPHAQHTLNLWGNAIMRS